VTLVVDASAVVAALLDDGPPGRWAREAITSNRLAAPHLLGVEATNLVRRTLARGAVEQSSATAAQRDLIRLPVKLYAFAPVSGRVWELRHNLTAYDAWHVALAEAIDATLLTPDRRLASAPGPRCAFDVGPPG